MKGSVRATCLSASSPTDFDQQGVKGDRTSAGWFLTSPKALGRIALTVGLKVRVINGFSVDEESA